MGYIKHNAIVVTSWRDDDIESARTRALADFADTAPVTPITPAAINGQRSFMVAPDGSKEGWPESDRGDAARAQFIEWLARATYCDWAEITFGGDDSDMVALRWSVGAIHGYEDATGALRAATIEERAET